MRGRLPEFVDPLRLARQEARLRGVVPLAAMARLGTLVRDGSGAVEIELRFRLSASGVPRVDGSTTLLAPLTCQRCLGPIDLAVCPELKVSFPDGDGALERAELAAGYEPLEREGPVGLITLVEDEILLALPDFPMHSPETCDRMPNAGEGGLGPSPFSELRARLEPFRT